MSRMHCVVVPNGKDRTELSLSTFHVRLFPLCSSNHNFPIRPYNIALDILHTHTFK